MKRNLLLLLICCFSILVQSQEYVLIPESHRKHPELEKSTPLFQTQAFSYELVHERTAFSRTFLHHNKTKTKAVSSTPLHYEEEGMWMTIDYAWNVENGLFSFPKQASYLAFNPQQNLLQLRSDSGKMLEMGRERSIEIFDIHNTSIASIPQNSNGQMVLENANHITQKNIFPGVDFQVAAQPGFFKTQYILDSKESIPSHAHRILWTENIELPNGWKFMAEKNELGKTSTLFILDELKTIQYRWHQAVASDQSEVNLKFAHQRPVKELEYQLKSLGGNQYQIAIEIDAEWLLDNVRVYPVVIDPVVTTENLESIPSCFMPNFQTSELTVAVPEGESILSSTISYDFVATTGTQAWMSDQRSFVSGPGGQTPIVNGTGNTAGTQTYTLLNSEIANGVSSGSVAITFHASRIWGGSGCNATFNFINRRYVEINYGTIEIGDGLILVNEYSASNRAINDNFGRTEDWIELHNTADNFVDLTGYYLSNDVNNPTQWQFSSGVIPPNSKVLVYCSRRDISSGTVFHTNFNLTQLRPDHIVFSNPQGEILESYPMWTTQINHSYGRTTDGAETWGVLSTPTPLQPNTGVKLGYTSRPQMNVAPGSYNSTLNVQLSGNADGEEIRYTLNGATPTVTSTLYTEPITVSQTTAIRARSFSSNPDVLPGFIETNTYLITENHTLPVFSFAGDADLFQLFNGNQSLEPIGNFEYFDKNGQFVDGNLGDFNKHGNDSWSYPQRGVDFISRDDYGYKRRLEHPFFSTSPRTRFRRLMVKAAANDNYPFATGGAHIRDSYVQTLSQLSGLDLDERSSTNVVVYVNGQYWGVYDLRERVDDNNYTDFYYNQDYLFRDSDVYLQFLKTWGGTEAHFGNQPAINDWNALRNFIQTNDIGDPSNFDFVDSQLNIESLIDYFVINSFVVSRDWLNYNTGWWRGLNPTGQAQKWRYILWDQEAGLGHYTNFTGMPNVTATAPPCQVENLTVGSGHAQILKKLIQESPIARQRYVTRYADLLNTHLSCERSIAVLDSMVDNIAPEMARQIQRWGGNMNTWQNNVQNVRNFINTRCQSLVTSLASCYNLSGPFLCSYDVFPEGSGKIKMNSEWLSQYPFQAQMYGNIETLLKAEAKTGYEFSHWVVDGAVIQPNTEDPNIMLMISQATSITAHFENPSLGDRELLYYWHFNSLITPNDVTTIGADFHHEDLQSVNLTYTGTGARDIDAFNTGSDINNYMAEPSGRAARVRNPSVLRTLVFDLPTTGFENIVFDYAVQRSGQGMLKNVIAYSLNGTNYTQEGLSQTEFDIEEDYNLVALDLSTITGVENNPNFKIRISFQGNTTTSNGNNRFDNIALKGTPMPLHVNIPNGTHIQLFPNPTKEEVTIISSTSMHEIVIYNMLGQQVMKLHPEATSQFSFSLNDVTDGLYMVHIRGNDLNEIMKLIIKK
jgi:hypothetical protein